MYAQLCKRLNDKLPNFEPPGKPCTFTRLLLNKCRDEFKNRTVISQQNESKFHKGETVDSESKYAAKKKMLGNIKFMGELGKLGMLHDSILLRCCEQLLVGRRKQSISDQAEDLECLCYLLKTCGRILDTDKAKGIMNQYFERMAAILENERMPIRIRFMIQDVIELRESKWYPRKLGDGPKTIQQVREDAYREGCIYLPQETTQPIESKPLTGIPNPLEGMFFDNKKSLNGLDYIFGDNGGANTDFLGSGSPLIGAGFGNGFGTSDTFNNDRGSSERELTFPRNNGAERNNDYNRRENGFSPTNRSNGSNDDNNKRRSFQEGNGYQSSYDRSAAKSDFEQRTSRNDGNGGVRAFDARPDFSDRFSGNNRNKEFGSSPKEGSNNNRFNNRFNNGNDRFNSGNDRFNNGNDRFNNGNDRFNNGNDRFNNGNDRFNNGNDRFNNGNDRFNNGSDRFNNGSDRFNNGTDRFNNTDKYGNGDRFDNGDRFNGNKYNNKYTPESRYENKFNSESRYNYNKDNGNRFDNPRYNNNSDSKYNSRYSNGKHDNYNNGSRYNNYQGGGYRNDYGGYNSNGNDSNVPLKFKKIIQQQNAKDNPGEVSLRPQTSAASNSIFNAKNVIDDSDGLLGMSSLHSQGKIMMQQKEAPLIIKQGSLDKGRKDKNKGNKGPTREEVFNKMDALLNGLWTDHKSPECALNSFKDTGDWLPNKMNQTAVNHVAKCLIDRAEVADRKLAFDFICSLVKDDASSINGINAVEALGKLISQDKEKELAQLASWIIVENFMTLKEFSDMANGDQNYPLFLLMLGVLLESLGKERLGEIFRDSGVSLSDQVPSDGRSDGKLVAILDNYALTFLAPLLSVKREMSGRLVSDPDPAAFQTWITENVPEEFHQQPGFILALFEVVIDHVVGVTTLAPGVAQPPDKSAAEAEKEMLSKFSPVLRHFVRNRANLQLVAVYALQVFCNSKNYPKGMLLRSFANFYDMDIVDEKAFFQWKEDVKHTQIYPGKEKALFQVNSWLIWLEEDSEEEDDDDD